MRIENEELGKILNSQFSILNSSFFNQVFRHTLTVRFRDMDAFGHVNNAVYLTYLEEARVAFFQAHNMRSLDVPERGTILAHAEIDYRTPARLGDVLHIDFVVSHVGNSSYAFTYKVTQDRDGTLVAEAKSVQVCFNFVLNRVIRVPAEWRDTLVKFAA